MVAEKAGAGFCVVVVVAAKTLVAEAVANTSAITVERTAILDFTDILDIATSFVRCLSDNSLPRLTALWQMIKAMIRVSFY
jgi:hypothetical protein